MIPKECKRLAEVDFPIAVVSEHSAREKAIRHGHPSTLQIWWARRPLASCRAMLMALLLPDPCDPQCPDIFKDRVRSILNRLQGKPGASDIDLRNSLLRFIGDFANWDNSDNAAYVEGAQGLVRAAYGNESPLVVDPFAGGGSIPLEAVRIGCDVFSSDINPVAHLIQITMLEHIPRYGSNLEIEFRRVAAETKAALQKELGQFYPTDSDGSQPIAYLWSRTVICDNCGSFIPLVRSFWLSKQANRRRALRCVVKRGSKGEPAGIEFEVFEPKNDSDVMGGTVRRAKAACLVCNLAMGPERLRAQLSSHAGGAETEFDVQGHWSGGARLLAVAIQKPNGVRTYRKPLNDDYRAVWRAQQFLKEKEQSSNFRSQIGRAHV